MRNVEYLKNKGLRYEGLLKKLTHFNYYRKERERENRECILSYFLSVLTPAARENIHALNRLRIKLENL